jgi:hypothetical protein
LLADAVAAVRDRNDDALILPELADHPDDRVLVRRRRRQRVAIAQRRANERGQRDNHVRLGDQWPHQLRVPDVAAHEIELAMVTDRRKTVLAEHEIVDDGDVVPPVEQHGHQRRPDVTGSARHEHTLH